MKEDEESGDITFKDPIVMSQENFLKEFFRRIWLTFSSPRKAFLGDVGRAEFMLAVFVTAMLGIGAKQLQEPYLAPALKESALQNVEANTGKATGYRLEEIKKNIAKEIDSRFDITFRRISREFINLYSFTMVVALFGVAAGRFIFRGKVSIILAFTVVAYVGFIGLFGVLVNAAAMRVFESGYVHIGLGLLKPVNDGSYLHYFLMTQSLASWWMVAVMAIGFGAIYHKPARSFGYYFGGLWLILAGLIASMHQVSSGTAPFY